MNDIVFVPEISNGTADQIAPIGNQFAACVNDSIRQFNRLAEKIPIEYQWVRISDDAFARRVKDISSNDAKNKCAMLNEVYWLDLLQQLEAMMVMNLWRATDLGRTAVNLLNRGDLGVGAIIARSSLENSAFFLHVSRKVFAIVDDLRKEDFRSQVITSCEIEQFVVSAVFGSGKESNQTEHDVPFNVLSAIKSVEKVYDKKNSEGIYEHYAFLSEIVHPNFMGRALYIQSDEALDDPGHFRTTIARSQNKSNEHALMASVAALSWAMMAQVSASDLMTGCVKTLRDLVNDATAR